VIAATSELFLPSIALGELIHGAEVSNRRVANLAAVEHFTASVTVLSCAAGTASHYGEIKAALRSKGRPLPDNDVWIAATARQHVLTVATRDSHFNEIPGLAILSR
jgi:tRNA(fMet)-specific endonuclease VapC